jgi:monoamine oxidase
MELGAEFIHGRAPALWSFIKEAKLPVSEVSNRRRILRGSTLMPAEEFTNAYSRCMQNVKLDQPDQPFSSFLNGQPEQPLGWKQFAIGQVEGFDAAEIERISVHSLFQEREASDRIEGDTALRVQAGYKGIVDWLEHALKSRKAVISTGAVVNAIHWEPGNVRVTDAQGNVYDAARAIIALPLGVLKAGDVKFLPELAGKREILQGMEMGHVAKVNLQFRSRFWPEKDFGFVHAFEERFPTFWSHPNERLVTAWCGGPQAKRMAGLDPEEIVELALCSFARLFSLEFRTVSTELESFAFHDWTVDPFARGAYSYISAGFSQPQHRLADPVQNTIFLSGEATGLDAQLGTVHGAISSG